MAGQIPQIVPDLPAAGFDGQPLTTLYGEPMDVVRFLPLAIRLTAALAEAHQRQLIHQNLQPRAILVDPTSGDVHLIHFAPTAASQAAPAPPVDSLESMPAYLAPEQTGRLRWPVDERSDLYALGVIFYELLTDAPLFQAADPLEWAHCHVARRPIPPSVSNPAIPQVLNDIVLKLLAKSADERYQSANGLRYDLDQCLARRTVGGQIDPFPLGQQDWPGRLVFPQQLYGRATEAAALLAAFEGVIATGSPALMLIAGYSGIGKSALVAELHKPVVKQHGYFISSKFDQYQRGIPYATIAIAFRALIQQLLTESEARIARWRQHIQDAVGANGQLIVELIPQVALIIGPQPLTEELPPAEAQHRLHMVFQQFVGVFTAANHPLVLFLDDLQWMDAASFTLLTQLSTHSDVRYLLLIGAYRDNEVGPAHPLMSMLEDLRERAVPVQTIILQPLAELQVRQILSDTLRYDNEHIAPLARLVFAKTRGNPFFCFQFVTALYQDGLLAFDHDQQRWSWNLAQLQARQFTENVVELMLGELQRLPPLTQRALQLAGLLGNQFDLASLALVAEQSPAETAADLWPALQVGLIMRHGTSYRFLHDRVQEAAYGLTPPEQFAPLQARIGRLLYEHLPEQGLDEQLFAVVAHLNQGAAVLRDPAERRQVAQLNLRAGIKARAATVYAAACGYLTAGMALLPGDSWIADYELTYGLYCYRAECEFLSGSFEVAEQLLDITLAHANTSADRVHAYAIKTYLYVTQGALTSARDTALESLCELGVLLPAHPMPEQVQQAYDEVIALLDERPIERLIDLPLLADPQIQLAMRALAALDAASFYTDGNLYTLRVCRMVALSLRYGNTEDSTHAYSHFGFVQAANFHQYQAGYAFTELAYHLREQLGGARYRGQVQYFRGLNAFWVRPLTIAITLQQEVFDVLVENGELAYASMCCNYLVSNVLASGAPLEEVAQEAARRLEFVRQVQFADVADLIRPMQQVIRLLRGQTYDLASFNDAVFNEQAFESRLTPDRMSLVTCRYQIARLMAHCIMGNLAAAQAAADAAQPLLWSTAGFQETHDYAYYAALTLAGRYDQAAPEAQVHYRATLQSYQQQLLMWVENNADTFAPTYALVAAEVARISGQDLEAMRLYEQAIEAARTHGFVQHQALANEYAARYYRQRNFATIAETYLRAARACYARWGADGKLRQLDALYPHLAEQAPNPAPALPSPAERLDVFASVKASQAISGELTLGALLDTLMRVTMEQVGADYGVFLADVSARDLQIAAEARVAGQAIIVTPAPALAAGIVELPDSIIAYVRRAREPLVLDTAAAPSPFSEDLGRLARAPRSILCLPVVRQAELLGLLYLENRLTTGAFTPQRLDVLRVLAAQAAISLENARLYSNLRHENAERRHAEARIMAALAEKELLLGEIHHRVKNNLQVISSLFSLQADGVGDPIARALLRASESRVRAMALIHERLYRFNDLEAIDFAEYVRDLITALYQAYGAHGDEIACHVEALDVSLGIDTAISCGLIVNELVSNALRHAFPAGRHGLITVTCQQDGPGAYRLCVADDGVGLSEGNTLERPGHIGLILVRELAEQLGGTLDIRMAPGTTITVRFHGSGS